MRGIVILVLVFLAGYLVVYPTWRSHHVLALERDGVAAFREQRWPEAARLFEKAVYYADDSPGVWYNLGVARLYMQDLEGGAAAFKKALSMDFNNVETLVALAQTQLQLGEYDAAEDSAKAALQFRPDNSGAYYILGGIYANTKRITNALAAYQQCVHYDGKNAAARYDLGVCYTRLGKYGEAQKELQESIRLRPSDVASRVLFGQVSIAVGDVATADEQQRVLRTLDRRAAIELLEYIQHKVSVSGIKNTNDAFSGEVSLQAPAGQKAEPGP